jgi:hypothetical protein
MAVARSEYFRWCTNAHWALLLLGTGYCCGTQAYLLWGWKLHATIWFQTTLSMIYCKSERRKEGEYYNLIFTAKLVI